MNRRGFLRLLGLSAAGALAPDLTLDPERALWVPGAKTFFLPPTPSPELFFHGPHPERGFRSRDRHNTLLTPDLIALEALRCLRDQLNMASLINMEYDARFGGALIGATVNVSIPPRFRIG